MKIIKLLLPLLLILCLALPTYAMHLPENKVINRNLTVEEDENLVNNNIKGESADGKKQVKTFVMSPALYFKRVLLPFLMLFSVGPIYLLIEREIKLRKQSKQQ